MALLWIGPYEKIHILSHWSSTRNLEAASICANKAFRIYIWCIYSAGNLTILGVICTISFSKLYHVMVEVFVALSNLSIYFHISIVSWSTSVQVLLKMYRWIRQICSRSCARSIFLVRLIFILYWDFEKKAYSLWPPFVIFSGSIWPAS